MSSQSLSPELELMYELQEQQRTLLDYQKSVAEQQKVIQRRLDELYEAMGLTQKPQFGDGLRAMRTYSGSLLSQARKQTAQQTSPLFNLVADARAGAAKQVTGMFSGLSRLVGAMRDGLSNLKNSVSEIALGAGRTVNSGYHRAGAKLRQWGDDYLTAEAAVSAAVTMKIDSVALAFDGRVQRTKEKLAETKTGFFSGLKNAFGRMTEFVNTRKAVDVECSMIVLDGKNTFHRVSQAVNKAKGKAMFLDIEDVQVILCEKETAAMAYEALLEIENGNKHIKTFVMRPNTIAANPNETPTAVMTDGTGNRYFVWNSPDGENATIAAYAADGRPRYVIDTTTGQIQDDPLVITGMPAMATLLDGFHAAMREDIRLTQTAQQNVAYNPETHARKEKSGVAVVVSLETGKIDNEFGPAMITARGESLYFLNGERLHDKAAWEARLEARGQAYEQEQEQNERQEPYFGAPKFGV